MELIGCQTIRLVSDYTTELVAEIDRDQTEVNERDNVTVAHNMQELQLWKKLFAKISINYREYVRNNHHLFPVVTGFKDAPVTNVNMN